MSAQSLNLYETCLGHPFTVAFQWVRSTFDPLSETKNVVTQVAIRIIKSMIGVMVLGILAFPVFIGRCVRTINDDPGMPKVEKISVCIETNRDGGYIGDIENQPRAPAYLKQLTLENGERLPLDPNDYLVPIFAWRISNPNTTQIPIKMYWPSALLRGKKEGETLRLCYQVIVHTHDPGFSQRMIDEACRDPAVSSGSPVTENFKSKQAKKHKVVIMECTLAQSSHGCKFPAGLFQDVFANQEQYVKDSVSNNTCMFGTYDPYLLYRVNADDVFYTLTVLQSVLQYDQTWFHGSFADGDDQKYGVRIPAVPCQDSETSNRGFPSEVELRTQILQNQKYHLSVDFPGCEPKDLVVKVSNTAVVVYGVFQNTGTRLHEVDAKTFEEGGEKTLPTRSENHKDMPRDQKIPTGADEVVFSKKEMIGSWRWNQDNNSDLQSIRRAFEQGCWTLGLGVLEITFPQPVVIS